MRKMRIACYLLPVAVVACQGGPATDRAAVDIGDLANGGKSVASFESPVGYDRGNGLIAYEGPGWESDRVGYRLYLDDRNAIDIFGKRLPELVLSNVGRGEDYHAMADWGMDILKVGDSLGAGGFGVFETGEVRQIGKAAQYSATVVEDSTDIATVRVTHKGSVACGGTDITADYTALVGTRLSEVEIKGDCALPLAAALVIHPGTSAIRSEGQSGWQYIGRWGDQSLVPDGLGLALFYKAEDVAETGQDADDDYIVFKQGVTPRYKLAAAWAQESGEAVTSAEDFQAWLETTVSDLNR